MPPWNWSRRDPLSFASSLDVKHQLAIMRLAKDFARASGGVIAVMHDLDLTAMFADHVLMLETGRLYASGAPEDVFIAEKLNAVYDYLLAVGRCRHGLIRVHPRHVVA